MRYEMTDCEWTIIQPVLPDKPRGVPRVNDRRVLNGIFWVLRSWAPWRDLPDCYALVGILHNNDLEFQRYFLRSDEGDTNAGNGNPEINQYSPVPVEHADEKQPDPQNPARILEVIQIERIFGQHRSCQFVNSPAIVG